VADYRRFRPARRSGAGLAGLLSSWLLLACALAPQAALAAGDGARAPAAEHIVTLESMRFQPQTLTVKVGDRITWVNKDMVPHTASATSGAFDSQTIAPDASWTYVAGKPGSYPYICRFHPDMQATLIVQ
jgi:plastocyanin